MLAGSLEVKNHMAMDGFEDGEIVQAQFRLYRGYVYGNLL